MPIPVNEWKGLIEGALKRFGDSEYQRQAWFNRHKEQTSPEEQINQLLGDYGFEEFIKSSEIGLSMQQKDTAERFVDELKSYGKNIPGPFDPLKVIDDPAWESIRAGGRKLLSILFEK